MKSLTKIYTASFLFSIQLALAAYVNSIFLGSFVSDKILGLMYVGGSLITITGLFSITRFIKKFGNYITILLLVTLNLLSLYGLYTSQTSSLVIPSFLLYLATNSLIMFSLDIFVENFSDDTSTGKIRGLFLTITNLAWVASPFIAGIAIQNLGYRGIYGLGILVAIPLFALLALSLKKFVDPVYTSPSFKDMVQSIRSFPSVKKICAANFMLQFFYVAMVIYTPLYLSRTVGFDWGTIGILFTIMLIPFVVFEYPFGKIADRFLGEKEILATGFLVMGISTVSISFIHTKSLVIWALILFMTRVGASAVESMSDTYLFKQIQSGDTSIIGFYRAMSPLAYMTAPIFATILLAFTDFKNLFVGIGLSMIIGFIIACTLKDTK